MSKEDIAFKKMAMLFEAMEEANQQQDETMKELKAAAFEVLLLNPGCEQTDWAEILIRRYGTEVVDALGNNPTDVYASLADLWESPYFDKNSGLEYDYKTWAEIFNNEASVQMYYDMTEKNNKT